MAREVLDSAQLDVIALDDCSWRVASRELEPSDPQCVLAYVELRKGGRFSILMLAPRPGVHAECSTMDEALTLIAAQGITSPIPGAQMQQMCA
jgi:hypothetical protein